MEVIQATSGRNLLSLIDSEQSAVVTTIINKFDKALKSRHYVEKSNDAFILVDEAHRSQYKNFHARMRQMLPNACYIGFTGTPLMKKDKNSYSIFGGLIDPCYTIQQANEDGAVVPLLYEGRHAELKQDKAAIDLWLPQGLRTSRRLTLKRNMPVPRCSTRQNA